MISKGFEKRVILLIVIIAISNVSKAIDSTRIQKWRPFRVLKTNLVFNSEFDIAKGILSAVKCLVNKSCSLICETETGYGLSSQEYEPEYFENSPGYTYLCWTKLDYKYPKVKKADGLYYITMFRRNKLHFNQCIYACRQIPGYRLAIAKTQITQNAMVDMDIGDSVPQNSYYVGLKKITDSHGNAVGSEWMDGTPYNATIHGTVVDNAGVSHAGFLIYGKLYDDWTGPSECLCQGNPEMIIGPW